MRTGNGIRDDGSYGHVCRDCHIECPSYMSRNEKPSNDDVWTLMEYLSSRYNATSLMMEVRELYDPNYLAFFGMRAAMESYLGHIKDRLCLKISKNDLKKIADAIVDRGDITF